MPDAGVVVRRRGGGHAWLYYRAEPVRRSIADLMDRFGSEGVLRQTVQLARRRGFIGILARLLEETRAPRRRHAATQRRERVTVPDEGSRH
jgi:hypothetical protein